MNGDDRRGDGPFPLGPGDASPEVDWRLGPERFEPTPAQYEAAVAWLMRLRETEQDSSPAFEDWKRQHPAHEFAFAEVEAMFAASAQPARDAASHYHRQWTPPRRARSWLRFAPLALAACLLLSIALPIGHSLRFLGIDQVTRAGEMRRIRLADGSLITLNSRTALDTRVDGAGRSARLLEGEAYFEIAHDPSRPFTIQTGDTMVRVLGTKFNVRADDDQSVISVTQGRVQVTPLDRPEGAVVLGVGQEAVVSGRQLVERKADPLTSTSWRMRKIIFRSTPLRLVVRELNRYRSASIYIMDRKLGEHIVTGVFRTDDPDGAIRIIDQTLGARSMTLPTGQTFLY